MSINPNILLFNKNKILSVSSFVYKKSTKQVLIIQRGLSGASKNLLSFPGGKFEIKQDANYLAATKREVMEETGIKISFPNISLLQVLSVNKYLLFTSISEFISQQGDVDKSEISNMFWLSKEDIEKEITEKNSTKYLKDIIYKGFEFAEKTFNSNKI